MKIEIKTLKVGMGNMWWTYHVFVNRKRLPAPNVIYRMYHHEGTAVNNAIKLLTKHKNKIVCQKKIKTHR